MTEQLHRSSTNKVIAGVCGGLAEYFNIDATLVRLLWALAFFLAGTGFILYILAWVIIPDDPANVRREGYAVPGASGPEEQGGNTPDALSGTGNGYRREDKRHLVLGLTLIVLGVFFMLDRIFPFFRLHNLWPLILIIIGIMILMKKGGSRS